MMFLGLDAGTTTLCAVVLDDEGQVVASRSRPSAPVLAEGCTRTQDAEEIARGAREMADELLCRFPDIASIGISCQMHGILYTDAAGRALSPLINWQDGRGDEACPGRTDGASVARDMAEKTGRPCASGYGMVTLRHDALRGLIPRGTKRIAGIGDYIASRLTGENAGTVHVSNAASFGCFDLKSAAFDRAAAERLALPTELFPAVCRDARAVGQYRGRTVACAIGDNQASYIGSGAGEDGILVNVGTGSQVSVMTGYTDAPRGIELRPLTGGSYLLVGSALSGGRAYAALERFFREVLQMAGLPGADLYPCLTRALEREGLDTRLVADTRLSGTREDPAACGSITGIREEEWHPDQLALAFVRGMAEELHALYRAMGSPARRRLVASGGGIRKNPALAREVSRLFGKEAEWSACEEEAARGAALFAAGSI